MKIFDLDNAKYSKKNGLYGGAAGSKDGILLGSDNWIVKYPKSTSGMKDTDVSYTSSPLCEFIGSHIFGILGYDVHDTMLGIRHDKVVVACKDFTNTNTVLAEIRTVKNHANETMSEELGIDLDVSGSDFFVDFEQLMIHVRHNPILKAVEGVEERFFEQAVVDIYINNNDRNNGNWGILRHLDDTPDELAPIYDNGGCLQTKISTDKAKKLLEDPDKAAEYACGTQTVYKDVNGKILSSKRFLMMEDEYPLLRSAIIKIVPVIKARQDIIFNLIDDIPTEILDKDKMIAYDICDDSIKDLFKLQLNSRLENLLIPTLEKVKEETKCSNLDRGMSEDEFNLHI